MIGFAYAIFIYKLIDTAPIVIDIVPRDVDVFFDILDTFGALPGVIGVALTGMANSYELAFAVAGGLAVFGGMVFFCLVPAKSGSIKNPPWQ